MWGRRSWDLIARYLKVTDEYVKWWVLVSE